MANQAQFDEVLAAQTAAIAEIKADTEYQKGKIQELVEAIEVGGLSAVQEDAVLEALKDKLVNLEAIAKLVDAPVVEEPTDPEVPTDETEDVEG